jgi:hypothetical protein
MGSRLSGAVCSRVRCLAGGSQRDGGAAGGGDHIVSCWLPSRSSMCMPARCTRELSETWMVSVKGQPDGAGVAMEAPYDCRNGNFI